MKEKKSQTGQLILWEEEKQRFKVKDNKILWKTRQRWCVFSNDNVQKILDKYRLSGMNDHVPYALCMWKPNTLLHILWLSHSLEQTTI
jgi:hypothetical protein